MTYSGATQARTAREALGKALEALQQDPNIPNDVLAVAQNIALAVGALFEAERASSEPDGKASVKSALGSLSQTLALLQPEHQQVTQQAADAPPFVPRQFLCLLRHRHRHHHHDRLLRLRHASLRDNQPSQAILYFYINVV